MSELPTNIWMINKDRDDIERGTWVEHDGDSDFPVQYIRADVVDGLIKKLERARDGLRYYTKGWESAWILPISWRGM